MDEHRQRALGAADGDDDDIPVNPSPGPTIAELIERRLARRAVLKGALGVSAAAALGPLALAGSRRAAAGVQRPRFTFEEIAHGVDGEHHVAPGYRAEILIRWGDPVVPGAPPFDPLRQSAAAQARQFGYNNDYLCYLGLPLGSDNPRHGLLCVNHEYTNEEVMFPGIARQDKKAAFGQMDRRLVDIEMAAHGISIVEIDGASGSWRMVAGGRFNRRITALATPMRISGPAAGDPRMRSGGDPTGTAVIGTVNNCAGGVTPWRTVLSCEENFHGYFWGRLAGHAEERNYRRYGVGRRPSYAWGKFHDRFHLEKEPNEANRFGWVVEVDPFDPAAVPVKRTALGRFKHEGAEAIVSGDGRVVVYMGDDQRFEYLYRFATAGRFDPDSREANRDLLDDGVLSVARFDAGGTLRWLPLVHGIGPLTAANGFASQADVLIETRRAADLLGATPMDRPEDVAPNPTNGKVYVMLTNNAARTPATVDAVNPRPANIFGHILELTPAGGDHGAETAAWEILVRCGDPAVSPVGALWNPATTADGWFASPDNCTVDHHGRLWIATDQGAGWSLTGTADGLWALETEGALRGTGKMFFRTPVGAELCGPCFTADDRTLFVAVQHPAVDGSRAFRGRGVRSSFADPITRWPDFRADMPPRPAVVTITRNDGGIIGG